MLEASLVVNVSDQNGGALQGAQVRLKSETAQGEWAAQTNTQGGASFSKLPLGI
jgi:hypothetical protein